MTLYDILKTYVSSDSYPFHMPGHKRRFAHLCDPALIDLTEIDGFDSLHHAEGILLDAQRRAARLYGSSETHFLVNGSTGGILSAIGSCARPGSLLLMARSSHRSAFHAAALNRLRTAYLYPEPARDPGLRDLNGPVTPAQVQRALDCHPDVCAVFLTSPTYDGVVSDVGRIAEITHRRGIPLIVDEAHGAHFGMHPAFPASSVQLGADLVIHSLHKTLPALTQSALLHVNGNLIDRPRLRRLLGVYQTSSPSYVLMASIDQCVRLLSEDGPALFDDYARRLMQFYQETKPVHFSLLRTEDPSRILIRPRPGGSMDALQLYHTLRTRFRLQPEMAATSYVLMLSTVCDDEEGFRRLSCALQTLDREAGAAEGDPEEPPSEDAASAASRPLCAAWNAPGGAVCTIAEALDAASEAVPFSASEGRVSAEFLYLYPPGVPLLLPGEEITAGIIEEALRLKSAGYSVQGTEDYRLKEILVVRRQMT